MVTDTDTEAGQMGKSQTRRQRRQAQRRRQRLRERLIWGSAALATLALIGFLTYNSVRPPMGEEIPEEAALHVEPGSDPGPYNSDPPTSGRHYAQELEAGFYDEDALQTGPQYPEGYLVHNLEHGYVLFWYNCQAYAGDCAELKVDIRDVLESFGYVKVLAYPRASLDVPVVLTSWGRLLRMETFDPGEARAFVRANRNRAPEPNAP